MYVLFSGKCECSNGPQMCPLRLPEDWMNHPNANGSEVVEAVVQMLIHSGIFGPDHRFLRRIAIVETKDGTETMTSDSVCNSRVGIWGITTTMLRYMQDKMRREHYPRLMTTNEKLCQRFGVNMSGYERLDLTNALVSGIAARFYLLYKSELRNMSLPRCVSKQAMFWDEHYRNGEGNSDHDHFEKRVLELEGKA